MVYNIYIYIAINVQRGTRICNGGILPLNCIIGYKIYCNSYTNHLSLFLPGSFGRLGALFGLQCLRHSVFILATVDEQQEFVKTLLIDTLGDRFYHRRLGLRLFNLRTVLPFSLVLATKCL